jgi:integrase
VEQVLARSCVGPLYLATVRSPLEAEDRNGAGRLLSDLEIRSIWHACDHVRPNVGVWVRWLFLAGMRRTSAARITREQIAPDWSAVSIPGSITKPGYTLPLSADARLY